MISNTENQANMGGEKIMQEQHHGQQRLGIYLTQVLLHKGRAQLRPKTRQWTVSTGLFFNIYLKMGQIFIYLNECTKSNFHEKHK